MKSGKPQITEGVRILWHSGYYDGPMSGVAEYNGEKVYFNLLKEYESKKLRKDVWRTYNLYKITPELLKDILYWHEEFRLFVGEHCDYIYDDDQKKTLRTPGVNPCSHEYMVEMFYDRYKEHEAKNGKAETWVCRPENLIGWITYDVLMGRPGKVW